jgi:hypothetical protein
LEKALLKEFAQSSTRTFVRQAAHVDNCIVPEIPQH